MSTTLPELRLKMQRELASAREIADAATAAKRELTSQESTRVEQHMKAHSDAKLAFDVQRAKESDETIAALKAIGVDLGIGGPSEEVKATPTRKGPRAKAWAEKVTESIDRMGKAVGAPDGVKALVSGSISVPNLLDQGTPVEIDATRTTVLDLLERGNPPGERQGNEFKYVRQTARQNNAAAVADLQPKPTSTYTFGEVSDRYRVYANKTEDLPYRYLSDYSTLIEVVRTQLAEDTILAIEADVLSGDGTGEGFTGLLETSGIQAQAFTTDILTTLSRAKYKLIAQELAFDGWVLNPQDLEQLENLRENGTTGAFLFKSQAEIAARLGAPIAVTAGIPAGTALVGDFSQAQLIPVGDDELVVDTGKRTTNNSFLLMYEGRYGFRVKKPVSFVQVDLEA
ncbi:phage major capsid protein [Microbacterium marinilacus]|uniref:Phage capsid-like C-terminal domain-containing protein n=1 Tax=Microbacterium marinilacus TaxID=415209 RepID=A0ABP7BC84_9MICO|nr:phage major capsid protein [Microbacterium marinilacus]MBY0687001.1 phage major capsid protein [Microbacterium marinilacus]